MLILLYKLNPVDYKYIVKKLRDYPFYDEMIARNEEELKQLLENLTPNASKSLVQIQGKQTKQRCCSEPERWAILRNDNPKVVRLRKENERMARHKKAIENSMIRFSDLDKKLFQLHFIENATIQTCCKELNYSKSMMYTIKDKLILKIAPFFGKGFDY